MSPKKDWNHWVEKTLQARRDAGLLRTLEAVKPSSAVHVEVEGRRVVLFSSNDYLGLSEDERVIRGVQETVEKYGLGPRGSPLICGHTLLHQELEERLAGWKKTESALLFPTGFSANLAVISAVANSDTTIFSDELNHASIIDGCTLARRSGARLRVYPHRDASALEKMLRVCETKRALVVTDSVFSMDGDLAPLVDLTEICEEHGALFMIDEAHGSFVFGKHGRGLAAELGVSDKVDIHIGTLSKGAGNHGGFVATTTAIKTLLLNLGRSYIYSTAAPLSVIGGVLAALDVVESDDEPRQRLWSRVEQLGDGLGVKLKSPIVPIVIGDKAETIRAAKNLREAGIGVTAIRPPTVAEGTSRLRVTLSAAHSSEDVDRLLEAIKELSKWCDFTVGYEGL